MEAYGKSSNELFTQFLARIAAEMPTATIAIFSKLKYVNAPNFEKFRQNWSAQFQAGFIVHSKAFDGLDGNFPIGFLIWKTNQKAKKKTTFSEITTELIDKNATPIGDKTFYNVPNKKLLNVWMKRPKANSEVALPLKNAFTPFTGKVRVQTWAKNAIGYMYCGVNDFQHANRQTVLFSSPYGGGNGFYVTKDNLWQAAVIFSVRRLITPTWINDRDQFYQPTAALSQEFKNDCLIWMLFHGSNVSASANNLVWNDKKWSIVNHFIPFLEEEVKASGAFESHFMADYLKDVKLSTEAKLVMSEGKKLWQIYFKQAFERKIRDELKLNRPDVGWYQVRKALEMQNDEHGMTTDFRDFKDAFEALKAKLAPQTYELGFIK